MSVCDELRLQVRELKCYQGITYKEVAELLEIKHSSLINFLNNQYDLGKEKQERLQEIINDLKE